MNWPTDRAVAAIDLIGRTGAKDLEVGFLHDDVPVEEAGWWAAVRYRGAKVMVEGARSPEHAVDKLLTRLLDGGQCRYCGRLVTNRTKGGRHCRYRLEGQSYVRGCVDTHPEPTIPKPEWL